MAPCVPSWSSSVSSKISHSCASGYWRAWGGSSWSRGCGQVGRDRDVAVGFERAVQCVRSIDGRVNRMEVRIALARVC